MAKRSMITHWASTSKTTFHCQEKKTRTLMDQEKAVKAMEDRMAEKVELMKLARMDKDQKTQLMEMVTQKPQTRLRVPIAPIRQSQKSK